uniref:Uncharacterized protein n=1 Tax=Rhizophagus irregularis (strain DAOM 181602 / DAOM 197198 / MUCL 43194) TaxID=747089 RepID=U9ULL7_RHIID
MIFGTVIIKLKRQISSWETILVQGVFSKTCSYNKKINRRFPLAFMRDTNYKVSIKFKGLIFVLINKKQNGISVKYPLDFGKMAFRSSDFWYKVIYYQVHIYPCNLLKVSKVPGKMASAKLELDLEPAECNFIVQASWQKLTNVCLVELLEVHVLTILQIFGNQWLMPKPPCGRI